MWRKLALLAAFSSVAWLSTAGALGLGEIDVKSGLNQRFAASIPLIAASKDEAEGLQVGLASNAEFDRAGIDRSEYLSSLRFTVQTEGGAPRIEVRSSQIAREPFVNFLVEVRSAGGRLLREYTILLDPPSLPGAAATVAPVAAAAATPSPAPSRLPPGSGARSEFFETSEEAGRRPSGTEAPAAAARPEVRTTAAAAGEYGPVQPHETFWSIASKLRPDPSITMDQMLLAIFEANRGAFDGGINGLRVGTTLRIPSPEEITATPPAVAKTRVTALRSARHPKPARSRPATPPKATRAAPLTPEPPAPPAPSSSAPAIAPPPAAAPTPVPPPAAGAPGLAPPAPEPAPAPAPAAPAGEAVPPPASEMAPPSPEAAVTAPEGAVPPVAESPVPPPAELAEPTLPPPPAPITEEAGPVELLVPVIGGLLVLGGLGYLVGSVVKKRRQRREAEEFAPPVASAMARPPLGAAAAGAVVAKTAPERSAEATRRELESLSDTLNEDTASFATRQLQTQQIAPQPMPAPVEVPAELPTFDSTQIFGTNELDAARKAVETGGVDFDVTGQFAADTVQINLEAGDPVAEADFHLAYGLYDEAILLLKQAAEKDPGRSELRVKLAETYFAAGRAEEFRATAEPLQGRVDAASWQKLAIMGQQLCPEAPAFRSGDLGAVSDVDLAFDEPSASPAASSGASDMLDFKLEELELPEIDQGGKSPMPELKRDDALEFDLGDFDLGAPEPAKPAAAAAPAENSLEFDLENFDLAGFDEPTPTPTKPAAVAPRPAAPATELKLEDFEVGDFGDSDSISAGDEAATKLDLARAYVDMGDNDMARGLLNEVVEQGSDPQKNEARALLGRLG